MPRLRRERPPVTRWTDQQHLALVLVVVLAVDAWIAMSRYQTATWIGREPLPTFLAGDGPMYRATLLSLIHDGDLDVRNQFQQLGYPVESKAALGARGEWYPKPPVLMSLLSAPFFLLDGDRGLLDFNIAQLAALAGIGWLLARRFASAVAATIATLVFALGTMLRNAAYNWSPDVLSTTLTLASVFALLSRWPAASGLLLALAVWAKMPNLVLVPILGAFAFHTDARLARRFAVTAAAGFGVIGMMNWWMFGSPFLTSYDRVIAGFDGGRVIIEPSHRTFFDVPFVDGLWRQLFDGEKGLLASAPVLPAAILGLVPLFVRNAPAALTIGASMVAMTLFFAPYRLWDQSNFGHRFLLTVVALGIVPFAALIDSLRPARKRVQTDA